MLILFDNGTPRGLARFLIGHSVEEAWARGREELANGEPIECAEQLGFQLLITTDKNMQVPAESPDSQARACRSKKFTVPMVKCAAANIVSVINASMPGSCIEIQVPFKE